MKKYIWDIIVKNSSIVIKTKFLQHGIIATRFAKFKGVVIADHAFRYSEISVQIFADSLFTQNSELDDKLRSPGYYHIDKHPEIIFNSTDGCKFSEGGIPELNGRLAIKELTRPLTLVKTFTKIDPPSRRPTASFHLYGQAKYRDWQIGTGGSDWIGDDMLITVELQLMRSKIYHASS